jgi:hypothetical protein
MYFHWPTFARTMRVTFSRGHFHPVHAAWVMGLACAFLVLRSVVLVGRALDHIIYPAFRRQPLRQPVFIVGNPRSGTTLLHRLMSLDRRFTTMRLFETIFPSVAVCRFIDALARADNAVGGPAHRTMESICRRAFSAWTGIHRTKLSEPEEDEQLFVYSLLTPVLTLLFPFFSEIEDWNYVDRLDTRVRRKLMGHYFGSLQRHLYYDGGNRTLLIKNTAASGRFWSMLDAMPDMRVVHLVRHPYESVASLLSMYAATWRRLAPQVAGDTTKARSLAYLFCDYYRYRIEVLKTLPASRVVEVRYDDLTRDPEQAVRRVYSQLGITATEGFDRRLRLASKRARSYASKHVYGLDRFGITEQEIHDRLSDVFEEYGFDSAIPSVEEQVLHQEL